jgi:hypothetical protein
MASAESFEGTNNSSRVLETFMSTNPAEKSEDLNDGALTSPSERAPTHLQGWKLTAVMFALAFAILLVGLVSFHGVM